MSRRFGYFVEQGPEVFRESDTSTCGHCQKVTYLKPQPGRIVLLAAPCSLCHRLLCEECKAKGGCDPFEKKLERWEAHGRLLEQNGGV